ncbi:MAG TPA: molybdate ABC transporter permease subunit [Thermoanaerobaculia bacterium]|nr:molybdate ABC transporter permease subunit [Thermoanaerobaculia bacterium]
MTDLAILLFTLRVAATSTALIAPIALVLAALTWQAGARLRALIDAAATLPLVLPPTAVGFVLLAIFSRRRPAGALLARLGVGFLFTPRAVVLAAAVMSFPLVFMAFRAAIDSSEIRYFQIARTLGLGSIRAFIRVTLPLAWRGILGGIILGFCRAIGEFGATILIAGNIPGRTQTLALAIYNRVESGHEGDAVLLLIYVVLIALTSLIGSEVLIRRQQRRLSS